MKQFSPPKNPFFRAAYLLTRRFLRHNVGAQSAALAFYLLFMLFPFLIFISALPSWSRRTWGNRKFEYSLRTSCRK